MAMAGSRALLTCLLIVGMPVIKAVAQAVDPAAAPTAPRYCAALRMITQLAASKDRFVSIAGKARDGNYLETTSSLPGWHDCSLYGPRTYTCDSAGMPSREIAEAAHAATLLEFKACLGPGWSEASDRSSASYVVLHEARRPVSITLSTDETEQKQHVVRVIVFRRGN
jgi:hypothetical protein